MKSITFLTFFLLVSFVAVSSQKTATLKRYDKDVQLPRVSDLIKKTWAKDDLTHIEKLISLKIKLNELKERCGEKKYSVLFDEVSESSAEMSGPLSLAMDRYDDLELFCLLLECGANSHQGDGICKRVAIIQSKYVEALKEHHCRTLLEPIVDRFFCGEDAAIVHDQIKKIQLENKLSDANVQKFMSKMLRKKNDEKKSLESLTSKLDEKCDDKEDAGIYENILRNCSGCSIPFLSVIFWSTPSNAPNKNTNNNDRSR